MNKPQPSIVDPMQQPAAKHLQQHSRRCATAAILGVTLLLPGCAALQSLQSIWQPFPSSNSGHVVSVGEEIWTISFRAASSTADGDQPVSGDILIQKKDKVLQSIKHSLSPKSARGEDDTWILIEDVNNDGWPDFLLTHAPTNLKEHSVKSLYLFDAQRRAFELQTEFAKMGDIDKLSGCVVVTASEGNSSAPRTYCFSGEKNSWTEVQHRTADSSARCNNKSHNLSQCRILRNERDGDMRRQISNYIANKSKEMLRENRKSAARGFAKSLRVGHEQWLRYRDARCASYVIEYSFPEKSKSFELESCKLDLSGLQLRHYSSMVASLAK